MRENPWNELLHSGDKKNQTLQKIKEFYDERNWNISNADIRWLLPVLQDLFTEYPNIDIRSVLDDGKDNIERLAYVLLRLSLLDKLNDSFFNARVSGFFDKMGESKMKVYNVDSALRGDFEKATKEAIRKFLDGDMRYMGFIVLATSLLRYNVFSSHDNIYNFLKDMFRHEMFSSNVPYKNKETESFIDIFSELLKQVIDVNKEKAENLFDGSGDFLRQDIVILRAIKTNNKEVLSAAINHLNNVKTKILERDINKYKDNYIYLLLFAAALSYYLDTYERHEYIKPLIYDLLKPMNNMAPMWYFWADKNDVIAVLRTLLLEQMWHPDGWTLLYDLIHEILTTDYKYAGYFIKNSARRLHLLQDGDELLKNILGKVAGESAVKQIASSGRVNRPVRIRVV